MKGSWNPPRRQRTTGNWWSLGEGDLASPKDELPYRSSNLEWSSESHIWTPTHKWTQQFSTAFVHTHTYICTNNKQRKTGYQLEGWRDIRGLNWKYKGWTQSRKEKWENYIILFQLKHFKNKIIINNSKLENLQETIFIRKATELLSF